MQLAEIQNQFKELMLDHPDVAANPPADMSRVFDEKQIPLGSRLKVYRNNIVGSLTDVMVASFPVIEKLVSKEFLEPMARTFVLQNPPKKGCLNQYGQGFAEFIESFGPAKSLPYLPDIARLEIAMNNAYYASDDEPLSPETLQSLEPEQLSGTFWKLRDSVQLVSSKYPVDEIREFCLSEDQNAGLDLNKGGVNLMIYRPALEVLIASLEAGEYEMLKSLHSGKPLGEAAEKTLNKYVHFDFQAFLQKHLTLETFHDIRSNN